MMFTTEPLGSDFTKNTGGTEVLHFVTIDSDGKEDRINTKEDSIKTYSLTVDLRYFV